MTVHELLSNVESIIDERELFDANMIILFTTADRSSKEKIYAISNMNQDRAAQCLLLTRVLNSIANHAWPAPLLDGNVFQ